MSGQSRTTVFWTSAAILSVGLWGALGISFGLAERAGLGHDFGGKVGVAVAPIFFLSVIGAVMICRALRVSAESTTREVLTQPIPLDLPEPQEVRTDPKRWRVLAWGYLIPVALFVAVGRNSWPFHLRDAWLLAGGALFAAIFVHCLYKAIVPGPPIVRLDRDAVFTGLWRRTVGWDQIRRCEIITFRNVFGDVARITFKLYGNGPKPLMTSAFGPPFQPDEERLFNTLRSRFSESEVIHQRQVPAHES